MAASGHGNQPTITGIRGWTAEEWQAARQLLAERGHVTTSGAYTDSGRALRTAIEDHTDAISMHPLNGFGSSEADSFVDGLEALAGRLIELGEVVGTWPPPATIKSA